ncbi:MAG: hypothetical protein C4548_15545 [Desulfobacteraceae bacterium]|nr:MAG: hypothetical protein C4548_15545 [Desulfobacteraceae bacterium]
MPRIKGVGHRITEDPMEIMSRLAFCGNSRSAGAGIADCCYIDISLCFSLYISIFRQEVLE